MYILCFVEIILITLFVIAISFSCYTYFKLEKNKTKFDITNYKRKLLKLKLEFDKIENNHIENNLKYYKIKIDELISLGLSYGDLISALQSRDIELGIGLKMYIQQRYKSHV